MLGTDEEILNAATEVEPRLVAVDAPLSLPRGRASIEDRNGPHFRACDLALRRLHIPFFPITLGPMRMLTRRGVALRDALGRRGISVLETYPGGVQDLLGWPRKGEGAERLRRALVRFGFRGEVQHRSISHDELDAIACAHVARLFHLGRAQLLGDPTEGQILLPFRPREQRR